MVERIATTQWLAAAARVELEAVDDPDFRRLVDVAQYGPGSARRMWPRTPSSSLGFRTRTGQVRKPRRPVEAVCA